MQPRLSTTERRVVASAGICVAVVMFALLVGGVSLVLGMGAVLIAVSVALPTRARRHMARRTVSVFTSIAVAMWFMWFLAHNYPDRSRLDEPGLVPAFERYIDWIGDVVAGDLGYSQYSETVWNGISRSLPLSLQLLAYSQVLALLLAIPGALIGARYRGRGVDVAARGLSLFGLASPIIVLGPVLVFLFAVGQLSVFGVELGYSIFPAGRYVPLGDGVWEHVKSMTLPTLTLALTSAASYLVVLRSEVVQQLGLDHAQLAVSKGLPGRTVVVRHGLRPGSASLVALVAAQAALVMGNMVLVERIFTMPGFGDYVIIAIGRRDIAAVIGAVFVAAIILAVVNLVAEALLLALDPRVAESESQ